MAEYEYKVSDFEGPLDLLLYLIEKNKVDIYNIPIVEIADQFNAYVKQIQSFDVNYGSKFFVMAATLLQIKSRLLLPKPPVTEDPDEEDPQDVLVRQLVEYKRMKEAASSLSALWAQRQAMLSRQRTPFAQDITFLGKIEKSALYQAFSAVYASLDKEMRQEIHLSQEIYSVEECMERVTYVLRRSPQATPVEAVFRSCRSKLELVVTFLAVLELLKLGQCQTVADGEDGNAIALRYKPKTTEDGGFGRAPLS